MRRNVTGHMTEGDEVRLVRGLRLVSVNTVSRKQGSAVAKKNFLVFFLFCLRPIPVALSSCLHQ